MFHLQCIPPYNCSYRIQRYFYNWHPCGNHGCRLRIRRYLVLKEVGTKQILKYIRRCKIRKHQDWLQTDLKSSAGRAPGCRVL